MITLQEFKSALHCSY